MPIQQGQYAVTDETTEAVIDPTKIVNDAAIQINKYILEQQIKGTVQREMVYGGMAIDEVGGTGESFMTKYKLPLIIGGAIAMVGVAYVLMR